MRVTLDVDEGPLATEGGVEGGLDPPGERKERRIGGEMRKNVGQLGRFGGHTGPEGCLVTHCHVQVSHYIKCINVL